SSLTEQSSQLPTFFVENRGQMDPRVRFVMKRSGLTAYFLDAEILLSISGRSLPIRLVGANVQAPIEGRELVPEKPIFLSGTHLRDGGRTCRSTARSSIAIAGLESTWSTLRREEN
ncbi:MAG: hypothetical protein M3Y07_13985, partial [Acidobacteriota bacterium]|nr:hypothetical protein [Acidobacteriota bacterium]